MLCLTSAEISQLTGKTRPTAQIKALRFMAIDYKCRPDGSVMVLRSNIESKTVKQSNIQRTAPNWD